MEVTYKLTQEDFVDSFIAHRHRRWSFRILVSITSIFFGGSLFLIVLRPTAETVSNVAPMLAVAAVWGVLLWVSPRKGGRSQFTKQPSAQGLITLIWDTSGVHWRWDGGTANIEYKNFIRFLESKHHFLLYSSPACFNIVPKRAFTPEQLSEFRSLLGEHISGITRK